MALVRSEPAVPTASLPEPSTVRHHRSTGVLGRLVAGRCRAAVTFAGQGADVLPDLVALLDRRPELHPRLEAAGAQLTDLAASPMGQASGRFRFGFDLGEWVLDPEGAPPAGYLRSCAVSYPLVLLSQLLAWEELRALGFDEAVAAGSLVAVTGHSQGLLAALAVAEAPVGPIDDARLARYVEVAFVLGLHQARAATAVPVVGAPGPPSAAGTLSGGGPMAPGAQGPASGGGRIGPGSSVAPVVGEGASRAVTGSSMASLSPGPPVASSPMAAVSGVRLGRLAEIVDEVNAAWRGASGRDVAATDPDGPSGPGVVIGVVNGPDRVVVSGEPAALDALRHRLDQVAAREATARRAGRRGGAPLQPRWEPLLVDVAFHSPVLDGALRRHLDWLAATRPLPAPGDLDLPVLSPFDGRDLRRLGRSPVDDAPNGDTGAIDARTGDGRPGDAGAIDARTGDGRPGEGGALAGDARPADGRAGDAGAIDARPGDSQAGEGGALAGDARPADGRAGDVGALAEAVARSLLVQPVRWDTTVAALVDRGADWVLDLGPGTGVAHLTGRNLRGSGARVIPLATPEGQRILVTPGMAAEGPDLRAADLAPGVVELPDGTRHLDNRYTRRTGQPPVILPGMTPTTADVPVVAAAANAGFTAELAGGGQPTARILRRRMAELGESLAPGVGVVFNTLLLDRHLWDLHVAGPGLLFEAKRAGVPLVGLTVSAGVPEADEAVALLDRLTAAGMVHNAFKPGTVDQVRQVLAIADAAPHHTVFVHLEGGKAGGHHSFEDLDELLLATYHDLRLRPNVVLCVGGGVGTPARAAELLSGRWSAVHGESLMPVDAVLVGTAAMACAEAAASPQVKAALAAAPGAPGWVPRRGVAGGVYSGRSPLNADIHLLDNAAARAADLLLEVTGDEAARAARHDEIVEALSRTAKPWFGDLDTMTYAAVLARFAELCAIGRGGRDDDGAWGDPTWRDRALALHRRFAARLAPEDRGRVVAPVARPADLDDPMAALDRFRVTYPQADERALHPADRWFFLEVCDRPGKPVPFVPVIDSEARRWYMADALWQAQDDRYDADAVLVIPGPESVAGITRPDEPVAELLARFEQATLDELTAAGVTPVRRDRLADEGLAPAPFPTLAQARSGPLAALCLAPFLVDRAPGEADPAGSPPDSTGSVPAGPETPRAVPNPLWQLIDAADHVTDDVDGDGTLCRVEAEPFDGTPGERVVAELADGGITITVSVPALPTGDLSHPGVPAGGVSASSDPPVHDLVLRIVPLGPGGSGPFAEVGADETRVAFYATALTGTRPHPARPRIPPPDATDDGKPSTIGAGPPAVTDGGNSSPAVSGHVSVPDGPDRPSDDATAEADEVPVPGARPGSRAEPEADRGWPVRSISWVSTADDVAAYRAVTGARHGGVPLDWAFSLAWPALAGLLTGSDQAPHLAHLVHHHHRVEPGPAWSPHPGESGTAEAGVIALRNGPAGRQIEARAELRSRRGLLATVTAGLLVRRPDPSGALAGAQPEPVGDDTAVPADAVVTAREAGDGSVRPGGGLAAARGAGGGTRRERPRRELARVEDLAPADMGSFALIGGDHNPLHRSRLAARLAGLEEPIVHGMWTAARAEAVVVDEVCGGDPTRLADWSVRFTAPVPLGCLVRIDATRVAVEHGRLRVEVVVRNLDAPDAAPGGADGGAGVVVAMATALVAPPRTALVFPGQGIQQVGLGAEARARSRAARAVWDQADAHTQANFGFSLLDVVDRNPTALRPSSTAATPPPPPASTGSPASTAATAPPGSSSERGEIGFGGEAPLPGRRPAEVLRHPQGVLHRTEVAQVALVTLAAAQLAELRSAGALPDDLLSADVVAAGHSVGEVSALLALGVLDLEAALDLVHHRGLAMQAVVPRDPEGRSPYRLAAVDPRPLGDGGAAVLDALVAEVAAETGDLLEVVNRNGHDRQYVVAGTQPGSLDVLARRLHALTTRASGGPASTTPMTVLSGIDVPFHSSVLTPAVDRLRPHLELTFAEVDHRRLVGRWVPNLVGRPFTLDPAFVADVVALTGSTDPVLLAATAASAGQGAPNAPASQGAPNGPAGQGAPGGPTGQGGPGGLAGHGSSGGPAGQGAPGGLSGETGRRPSGACAEVAVADPAAVDIVGVSEPPVPTDRDPRAGGDPDELARRLLIELLAHQVANPVRWIDVQRALVTPHGQGGLGVARQVEVAPPHAAVLTNLAAANLTGVAALPPEVLHAEHDRDRVLFADLPDAFPDEATPVDLAGQTAPALGDGSPVGDDTTAPAGEVAPPEDRAVTAAEALRLVLAVQARVRLDQLADDETLEELFQGVSSRRNQVLIDLGRELGLSGTEGVPEVPLGRLAVEIDTRAPRYRFPGDYLRDTIAAGLARALSRAGLSRRDALGHLATTWGLGPGLAEHVLAVVAIETRPGESARGGPLGRFGRDLPDDADAARELLDRAVEIVSRTLGLDLRRITGTSDAAVTPEAVRRAGARLETALIGAARHVLSTLDPEAQDQPTSPATAGAAGSATPARGADSAASTGTARTVGVIGIAEAADSGAVSRLTDDQRLVVLDRELGESRASEVAGIFEHRRHVCFASSWAAARWDLVALYHDARDGRRPAEELRAEAARLALHAADPAVASTVDWFTTRARATGRDDVADLLQIGRAPRRTPLPVPAVGPTLPRASIAGAGTPAAAPAAPDPASGRPASCGDGAAAGGRDPAGPVEGRGAPGRTSTPEPRMPARLAGLIEGLEAGDPRAPIGVSDAGAAQAFATALRRSRVEAPDLSGEVALVTGASPGSIAAELVRQLLRGGATVVVATSTETPERRRWYRELYRTAAAPGATLHVLPANLASFADIDALVAWLAEPVIAVPGRSELEPGALVPTLLAPFAAVPTSGDARDMGPEAETALRVQLLGVERLVAAVAELAGRPGGPGEAGSERPDGVTVLLPLSPNHGDLGGDGPYGETKAALEVLVRRSRAERDSWGRHARFLSARIGWVRGTGLMRQNDLVAPLVEERLGVRTFSTAEMGWLLATACALTRERSDLTELDLTGGLSRIDGLRDAIAPLVAELAARTDQRRHERSDETASAPAADGTVAALPSLPDVPGLVSSLPSGLDRPAAPAPPLRPPAPPTRPGVGGVEQGGGVSSAADGDHDPVAPTAGRGAGPDQPGSTPVPAPPAAQVAPAPAPSAPARSAAPAAPGQRLAAEDMVVIVGTGELGPCGTALSRFALELDEALPAAAVVELAWLCGLARFERDGYRGRWVDTATGDVVDEADLAGRYAEAVAERVGLRPLEADGVIDPGGLDVLTAVQADTDVTFEVTSEAEARSFLDDDPAHTRVRPNPHDGTWRVTRTAGTPLRVPRQARHTRRVAGQLPTGLDLGRFGVPGDLLVSADRLALVNLACTAEAFRQAGLEPEELLQAVHPALVANTQGCGMGGMASVRHLLLDQLLGEERQGDRLQESLGNVVAAHVVQGYVGSYGPMVHPVAACATAAVSLEEAWDKIRLGKARAVVAGGYDDLIAEGMVGFGDMHATADSDELEAMGLAPGESSRANDVRRRGFVESQGGGALLVVRGDVAVKLGLPVLGVLAYAGTFGDGIHASIPAPGLGLLAAASGGATSPLAEALRRHGLTADDIAVVSKHDTSTEQNDPNEADLHQRLQQALGRTPGNPLLVVSQKTVTGHPKGGAAAWQVAGVLQMMASGQVPGNRNLDSVDPRLRASDHLVHGDRALRLAADEPIRAALVTSLGFGHVSALLALAHPGTFLAALPEEVRPDYLRRADARRARAARTLLSVRYGDVPPLRRTDRRLGLPPSATAGAAREAEAAMLLDPTSRLVPQAHPDPTGHPPAAAALPGATLRPGPGDGNRP